MPEKLILPVLAFLTGVKIVPGGQRETDKPNGLWLSLLGMLARNIIWGIVVATAFVVTTRMNNAQMAKDIESIKSMLIRINIEKVCTTVELDSRRIDRLEDIHFTSGRAR